MYIYDSIIYIGIIYIYRYIYRYIYIIYCSNTKFTRVPKYIRIGEFCIIAYLYVSDDNAAADSASTVIKKYRRFYI